MSQVASMIRVSPHTHRARSVPQRVGRVSPLIPVVALRPLLALVLLFGALGVHAQPPAQESLTDEFPGLSSKERSRIAKKEAEEAAADTAFQALMKASEALFQDRRYEEALDGFRQARAARPYNVYPKVKIHDLEAMLSKKAGEAAVMPTPLPSPDQVVDTDPAPMPSVPPAPEENEPRTGPKPAVTAPAPTPSVARPKVEAPVSHPAPAQVHVPPSSPVEPQPQTMEVAPTKDGTVERSYKEGNAFVIERSVTEDGRTTVFKRVIHPWGGTYHFRDGKAIDERVWKERFGGN